MVQEGIILFNFYYFNFFGSMCSKWVKKLVFINSLVYIIYFFSLVFSLCFQQELVQVKKRMF